MYKRLTKKAGFHKDIDLKNELGYSYIYQRLSELENQIENGTLIEPKYPLYSTVFIVDYVNEKGYSVGVGVGKPIARECFITTVSQVMKSQILYRVQPKDLPQEVLDGKVEHVEHWESCCYQDKQLFLTKAEAETKLKENNQ